MLAERKSTPVVAPTVTLDLLEAKHLENKLCCIKYYINSDSEANWSSVTKSKIIDEVQAVFVKFHFELERKLTEHITREDARNYPRFYEEVLKLTSKRLIRYYKEHKAFPSTNQVQQFAKEAVFTVYQLKDPLDRFVKLFEYILTENKKKLPTPNYVVEKLGSISKEIVFAVNSGIGILKFKNIYDKMKAAYELLLNTSAIPAAPKPDASGRRRAVTVLHAEINKVMDPVLKEALDIYRDILEEFTKAEILCVSLSKDPIYQKRIGQLTKIEQLDQMTVRKARFIEERKKELSKESSQAKEPEWKINLDFASNKIHNNFTGQNKERALEVHKNVVKAITKLLTFPEYYIETHKAVKLWIFTIRPAKKEDHSGFVRMLADLGKQMCEQYCDLKPEVYFVGTQFIQRTIQDKIMSILEAAKQRHEAHGHESHDESRGRRAMRKHFGSLEPLPVINDKELKSPMPASVFTQMEPVIHRRQRSVSSHAVLDAKLSPASQAQVINSEAKRHRRYSSITKMSEVAVFTPTDVQPADAPPPPRKRRNSSAIFDKPLIVAAAETKYSDSALTPASDSTPKKHRRLSSSIFETVRLSSIVNDSPKDLKRFSFIKRGSVLAPSEVAALESALVLGGHSRKFSSIASHTDCVASFADIPRLIDERDDEAANPGSMSGPQ